VLAREQRRVIYAPWGVRWGRDLPNVEEEGRVLGVEEIVVETSTVPLSKGRTGRRVRLARLLLVQICVLAVGAAVSSPPTEATTGHAPAAVRAAARAPVVTIAGDIAGSLRGDLETGPLVQRINPTYALVAGDEAYEDGTAADYAQYDQSWARFKAKTRPTPGNHDYHPAAGSPRGYPRRLSERQSPCHGRGA